MPLTKQQLLIPRVLCIGGKEGEPNYPGSRFMTGDIIEQNGRDYWSIKADAWLNQTTVKKFTHLFRPMEWWEGRAENEMPEYIKVCGTILKVEEYELYPQVDIVGLAWVRLNGKLSPKDLRKVEPASRSEWEAQQTKEA